MKLQWLPFYFLFLSIPAIAQELNFNHTPARLFSSDEVLNISLYSQLRSLKKDIGEESQWHPAVLQVHYSEDSAYSIPVRLQPRGNFRKNPQNCNFPPIRIDFKAGTTQYTEFENLKNIKLVTHCLEQSQYLEQCVLKEYLAYKILNLFTEYSYRVRLAHITYVDSARFDKPMKRYAFFIEPTSQLAERNGGFEFEGLNMHDLATQPEQNLIMNVFQYLIGNTDWSIPNLHNIRLFKKDSFSIPYPVPYDFDWSGLVEAPYAVPFPELPIQSVRERLYRGYCLPQGEIEKVFPLFIDKKQAIYQLVSDFEPLSDKEKKRMLKYFDEFYQTISHPMRIKVEFYHKCRTQ